jgi:hypothetical protein
VEEQNLPEGESERRTGPLDLALEEEVAIVERKREKESEREREFCFFFFPKGALRPVGLANLTSLKGWIYRWRAEGYLVI